jgi:hypothetical protein
MQADGIEILSLALTVILAAPAARDATAACT